MGNSNNNGDDFVKLHDALELHKAEKTRLVQFNIYPGYNHKSWFPISQTDIDDNGDVWVKRWLVEKKEEEINEMIILDKQFM